MSEVVAAVADSGSAHRHGRLPRLRTALAARDWIGIAIELIVVTVGVLLAFRVEQWGQERNRAGEEREFIERLHRENARSIGELATLHAAQRTIVTQLGTAIRAKSDAATLHRLARIDGFGCWGMQVPAATYNQTASEELLASGRLNLISDPGLRSAVRELAATQASSATQIAYSREIALSFAPYLHRYYTMSLGARPEPICFADWPSIMRDTEAAVAVARTYRTHLRAEQSRGRLLVEAKKVQAKLACALDKADCRP